MNTAVEINPPLTAGVAREPAGPAAPIHSRRAGRTAALLVAVLFFAYLSNLRFVYTGDTAATRYVPFSILLDGRLDVDRWIGSYLGPYQAGTVPWGVYFAVQARGHWMPTYPILTPLVVTPLYIPAALWIKHKGGEPSDDEMRFYAESMEKFSAALLTALSVGVLYLGLRRMAAPRASLAIALIYGLASPTWNISSQVLWQHALTELSLALLLWALLRDADDARGAFWIGLALALALANKPTNGVLLLPVLIYLVWRKRAHLLPFFAPMVVLGGLAFAYNLYYFHSLLGGYNEAATTRGYGSWGAVFKGNVFTGAAGLLVSPSRGALWYIPWLVFAVWGAARLWKENRWPSPWTPRLLLMGAVLYFLVFAKMVRWYAGYSFGPRYLTDLMPLAALCLVPLWPVLQRRKAVAAVFALTVALAFGVQVLGVYYYPNGGWNDRPVSVDVQPARLWDWSDPQILRTLKAGPAPTRLSRHLRGEHGLD